MEGSHQMCIEKRLVLGWYEEVKLIPDFHTDTEWNWPLVVGPLLSATLWPLCGSVLRQATWREVCSPSFYRQLSILLCQDIIA